MVNKPQAKSLSKVEDKVMVFFAELVEIPNVRDSAKFSRKGSGRNSNRICNQYLCVHSSNYAPNPICVDKMVCGILGFLSPRQLCATVMDPPAMWDNDDPRTETS
jgi:hypothetical protein